MAEAKERANKRSILVVDDEEDFRLTLEKRLFQLGYDVETAANGKHALQKLQSGKQFNLILCDLKMPLVSGVDFMRELRKSGSQVPVIIVTGRPEKEMIQTAAQFNLAGVMVKPIKPNDLMRKIEELLPSDPLSATAGAKAD